MKIIGISGRSGSGKNVFAGILAAIFAHLGYRALLDSFSAPIKWECGAMGWRGEKTSAWRRMMQATVDAIRKTMWVTDQRVSRWGFPTDQYWRREMVRAEKYAIRDKRDKLVDWLAYRNGFGFSKTAAGYYPIHSENHMEGRPDFLIVSDVRRLSEMKFCQAFGVVLFLDGSFAPLPEDAAQHESESGLGALRERADHVIDIVPGYEEMTGIAWDVIRGKKHLACAPDPSRHAFVKG